MATIPFWYPNPHQFDELSFENPPNPWDYCALGGVFLPGLAKVKVSKGRKLDVKQPPGSHGATITDRGYKPAPVEIVLTVWKPSQWTTMQALLSGAASISLEPKPNASYQAPAYPIDHPATAAHGITDVIIEDIEGPDESSRVKGAVDFKLKCLQFFPPPKVDATNTPKGTIASQPNALLPVDPSTVPPSP